MALLQISEPGQSSAADKRKINRFVVGIDLGTTNSMVATVRDGEATTLSPPDQEVTMPSAVQYFNDGSVVVGQAAKEAFTIDPDNSLLSVKRLMGRDGLDVESVREALPYKLTIENNLPYFQTVAGKKTAVEVSAEILKELKSRAERFAEREVDGAVITVPAYFDDAQRQATKDAAKLAGLKVMRLLNEPTAAAVAYGLDRAQGGINLVYDLGGGTFDVSVLNLQQGVFKVLATGGDTELGGDDFDREIVKWFVRETNLETQTLTVRREVLEEAVRAKESLGSSDSTLMRVNHEGVVREAVLDREILECLIKPLIDKTILICRQVLSQAEVDVSAVDNILLVGGSTRLHLVRDQLVKLFDIPILCEIDPDSVVALGAARQADLLSGNGHADTLLLDVTPLSLGIETMGGLVEKIVPRNTVLPVEKRQEFTTFKDGQTAMALHVLQGERETVNECRSLARFELKGLPPKVAGALKIEVSFQVDADGLLSVSAKELSTGVQSHVEVKPSYGLDEQMIETMLKSGFGHAKEDVALRMLKEQQLHADQMLGSIKQAIAVDGEKLLSDAELEQIQSLIEELEQVSKGSVAEAIEAKIAELNTASENFAAKRMDEAIAKALEGQSIDELEK